MAYERPDPAGNPPKPLGIGRCSGCAYLTAGTSDICYGCAREIVEALAPFDQRCVTCDLKLKDDGACGNPLCNWSVGSRFFQWNFAIAMRSGPLQKAIEDFKYKNRHGWRNIFGRVLVGFLDHQRVNFEDFDIITASPSYLNPTGARKYDHTREVIRAAHEESDGRWPFDIDDPAVIVKTAATEKFAATQKWGDRKLLAEGDLRKALSIPDAARTKGKEILVYDDLFTDGFTLREVARSLIQDGGASRVCGITLMRQPWTR